MNILQRYEQYVDSVIKWNQVMRAEPIDEHMPMQIVVTTEEIRETISAISEQDHTEILDGVADVLVTAGYMAYLNGDSIEGVIWPSWSNSRIMDVLHTMESNAVVGLSFHDNIVSVVHWATRQYSEDTVTNYIEAVLKSNDSKFIIATDIPSTELECYITSEVHAARNKYAGQWENIVAVKRELDNGEVFYVLRADNGTGKILKPTSFKEPQEFLDQD